MGNGTAEGTPGPREGVAEGPAPWTPGCSWGPIRGTTGGRRRAVGGVVLGCAGHSRGPGRLSKGARGTGLAPDCPPRSEHPSDPSSSCSLSPPGPGHVTLTWPPLGLQPPPQPGSAPAPWLLACEFLCLLPSPGNAHTTFRSRLLLEARPDAPAELGGASVLGGVQPPLSPVVLCSPLTRAWQTPVPLDTDQASGEMHPAMVSPPHSLSHLVTRNRRALVSGRASEPRAPTVCQTHCPPGPQSTQHAQGPWEPHLPTGHRKGLPGGGQDPRPQAWGPGPLLAIQHPAHGEPSTHVCHMVRLPGPEGTAKSDF